MPPSNTSSGTATLISSLPYDFIQTDINDTGVNYTVWYKFVAPTPSRVVGAWGWSGNVSSGYRPTVFCYDSGVNPILGISAQNKPIQFPVTAGQTYYLEFRKNLDNAGPNQVEVKCQVAPLGTIANGNIIVNDDTGGFPVAILSQNTDNTVINFVDNFAGGEAGDILISGIMCFEDNTNGTIKIYDSTFTLQQTTAVQNGTIRIKRNANSDKFWVVTYPVGGPVIARSLSTAGAFGSSFTLTTATNSCQSACANAGDHILYYAEIGASAIKRWNLDTNTALSDLAAAITNLQVPDIQVLSDTTIAVLYRNQATQAISLYQYNTTGTILHNYNIITQTGTVLPRMSWASNNPATVWIMYHTSGGQSIFVNVRLSDGTIIASRTQTEFEGGAYTGTATATPNARFGNSFSCPFFLMTGIADIGPDGLYVLTPALTHDVIFSGDSTTLNTKILDPFGTLYPSGD